MTRLRDLSDTQLLDAMAQGREDALVEFHERFTPLLEAYARKTRVPRWEWDTCITEVLDDASLWLASGLAARPANLPGYLVRAIRHRYLRIQRTAARRATRIAGASHELTGEWFVTSACSQATLRASAGPEAEDAEVSAVLARIAGELFSELTREDRAILAWIADRNTHRQIAAWLGVSYDASTKKIWRLCRRLRARMSERAAECGSPEREEIERFMRRVSAPASALAEPQRLRKAAGDHAR